MKEVFCADGEFKGDRSLYIHPFMLSRWPKQMPEGQIVSKGVKVDAETAAELRSLRDVKKKYERLRLEHEI